MNRKFIKLLSLVVILLLQPSIVYAMNGIPNDVLLGILSALFGDLPSVCITAFSSSDCISCMFYIKLFPFIFIFSFFFLIFYLVTERIALQAGQNQQDSQLRQQPYYTAIVLMSVVLAFIFVHYQNAIDYLGWWVTLSLFMGIVWFVGGFFGRSMLGGILALIVIALMFIIISTFLLGQIRANVSKWKAMCI